MVSWLKHRLLQMVALKILIQWGLRRGVRTGVSDEVLSDIDAAGLGPTP